MIQLIHSHFPVFLFLLFLLIFFFFLFFIFIQITSLQLTIYIGHWPNKDPTLTNTSTISWPIHRPHTYQYISHILTNTTTIYWPIQRPYTDQYFGHILTDTSIMSESDVGTTLVMLCFIVTSIAGNSLVCAVVTGNRDMRYVHVHWEQRIGILQQLPS